MVGDTWCDINKLEISNNEVSSGQGDGNIARGSIIGKDTGVVEGDVENT